MKKTITVFLALIMLLSFSACGWKVEIINPNEIIENDTEISASGPEEEEDVSVSEPEETTGNEYYDEVLEIPENPVKDAQNNAFSENFEFSEPTKEISVMTAAHYDKIVNLVLPESSLIEGEGDYLKAVFPDGSELSAGWIFVHKLEETTKYDDTLYYYRNPEKSLGYVSHEKAVCGEYECLRIICWTDYNKDNDYLSLPEEEKIFIYEYFFEISPSEVLSLSFYAKGPYNIEAMKLQEKIIANLSTEAPKSYVEIENGKLYGMIHPMVPISPEREKVFENEIVAVSVSVPEGWKQGTLEEEGEIYGITFKLPWDNYHYASLVVYKDNGTTYDDLVANNSLWVGIDEHTYHEVSGNFSKGSYIHFNYPTSEKYDVEEGAVPVYGRFYQLQFDGYVADLGIYIRIDSEKNTGFDEKICDEFVSSIKIGE